MYFTCAACRQRCLIDLELLVARVDELIGLPRIDDGDDRHVAIADDEADVLVGDLAEARAAAPSLAVRS